MAVISVTEEDILAGGESRQAEKETQQNLPELSIEELASLCVGYGPGTPFAAVGDRSDPSAIFDGEGKPITTNNHRQDIRDMFLRQLRKKGSSPFSIKTARPGSAVLPGRRKCS